MESLGKVFDFLILLTVLFIFPVNWAFGRAETVGDYSLENKVEEFLDATMTLRQIDGKELNSFIFELDALFKNYKAEIIVKRGVAEAEADGMGYRAVSYSSVIEMQAIEDDIENKGCFALYKNDILVIKVSDKNGVFLSGARLII